MRKELKYYVVKFCPITFKYTREEKIDEYEIITVKEYREKYNVY